MGRTMYKKIIATVLLLQSCVMTHGMEQKKQAEENTNPIVIKIEDIDFDCQKYNDLREVVNNHITLANKDIRNIILEYYGQLPLSPLYHWHRIMPTPDGKLILSHKVQERHKFLEKVPEAQYSVQESTKLLLSREIDITDNNPRYPRNPISDTELTKQLLELKVVKSPTCPNYYYPRELGFTIATYINTTLFFQKIMTPKEKEAEAIMAEKKPSNEISSLLCCCKRKTKEKIKVD